MLPIKPTLPGIHLPQLPIGLHTIAPASTSNTAFIDWFARGPVGVAQLVSSASQFANLFGGLNESSESSYQMAQYFLNGGAAAYAVRVVPKDAATASAVLSAGAATASRLQVSAANPGQWGNSLSVAVYQATGWSASNPLFTLAVQEIDSAGNALTTESFAALSFDSSSASYCVPTVNSASQLIRLIDSGAGYPEPLLGPPPTQTAPAIWLSLQGGADGVWDTASSEFADAITAEVTDATASLSKLAPGTFNILCIPATALFAQATALQVMVAAQAYCELKRAFYIVDVPDSTQIPNPQAMAAWFTANSKTLGSDSAAIYYPRLTVPDALNSQLPREVGSSGSLAGIYAATDTQLGVWKAPAGTEAKLVGAQPVYPLTDNDDATLNALGINSIRSFPVYGVVSWGARTLQGADTLGSEWKYIPVRRAALYLENSLYGGLALVAFEPNAQPLWSSITLSVGGFFEGLFRLGAFQGTTPAQAYFVKCDATTNTQGSVEQGIVNVVVGFAPLKPAEFVVIQIALLANPPH